MALAMKRGWFSQLMIVLQGRYSVITMLSWLKKRSKPALPAGKRVYAIGDVHGRLDLFEELIEAIRLDNLDRAAAEVDLILLGDLIDRGPDSRDVVERAREGVSWAKTIALKGNHEEILLEVLDGNRSSLESWLRFGGEATLLSWGVSMRTLQSGTIDNVLEAIRSVVTSAERAWLGRMRSHVRIGSYYFVHAGIRPGVSLDRQCDEDRLWIREEFLESRKNHGAMVVHGHSIHDTVEERPNRIGLDTGAYATGKLTAVGLEGDSRWFLSAPSA